MWSASFLKAAFSGIFTYLINASQFLTLALRAKIKARKHREGNQSPWLRFDAAL